MPENRGPEASQPSSPLRGPCPGCGGTLEPERLAGQPLHRCQECGVVVASASVLEAVARSRKEFPRSSQAGARLIGAGTCPACSGKLHALDYHPWALCERCLRRVVPPSGLAELAEDPRLAHTAPQFMPIGAMESGRREAPRALLLGGALLFFLISWLLFTPPSQGEAQCTAAKQDRSLSVSSVRKACERWLWGNAAMVAFAVFGGVLLTRGLRRHRPK